MQCEGNGRREPRNQSLDDGQHSCRIGSRYSLAMSARCSDNILDLDCRNADSRVADGQESPCIVAGETRRAFCAFVDD